MSRDTEPKDNASRNGQSDSVRAALLCAFRPVGPNVAGAALLLQFLACGDLLPGACGELLRLLRGLAP